MGDQEKIGLATMSAFFRRYVGGEGAFDPYMTGELSADGDDTAAARVGLPDQRLRHPHPVLRARDDQLLRRAGRAPRRDPARDRQPARRSSALGTSITGSGFAQPVHGDGGVSPMPATTAGGFDWCNPEPDHFAPSQLGDHRAARRRPRAARCPAAGRARRPERHARERAGQPLLRPAARAGLGRPAGLDRRPRIPAASGDVSGYKALALGAAVNFFDPRNPSRGTATRSGTRR